MTRHIHIVVASDIAKIVNDPDRGTVSLVGEQGGISHITGEVYNSSALPDLLVIETEHGSLYRGHAAEVQILEDDGGWFEHIEPSAKLRLNNQLTDILARLGWEAESENDLSALNELREQVATNIDNFLTAHHPNRG